MPIITYENINVETLTKEPAPYGTTMAPGDHSIKVTATLKVDGAAASHDSTLGFEEGTANVMGKGGNPITPNRDGTFTITSAANGAIEFYFFYDKEVIFTPYMLAADDQSQKMDLPEYIAFMTVKPVIGNFGYPVIENILKGVIQIDPSQTIIPVSLPRMAIANYSDWKQAKTALLVQGAKTQIYFGDLAEVITNGYPVSVANLNTDGTGENIFRYMFFNGETAEDGNYVTYTAVLNDDADSRPTDLRNEHEIARMYNYNTEITSPTQPIDFWFPLPTAPTGDYQFGNSIQIELRLDAYEHGTNTSKHGHVTATTLGLAQSDFDAATQNGYIVIPFTPSGGNLDDYSMSKDGVLGSFEIDYTVMDSSGRVLGRPIDTIVGSLNTGGPRSREK
ncbi:hypothetical protein QBD01_000089 [Ochrobactrum sp. 19YEA23]|uniref:hypothetical protein n=1 Tax=Ochrobactrum sp. 19YEA23 TaxID=3039854 RepID=UPI00247AA669|nr:hypothetical protein [Ochrobactrum sp. 19YEA23]